MVLKINIITRKIKHFINTSASMSTAARLKEEKIRFGKYEINYLRVGHGPHNVFCGPGIFGTIWTDFKHQIDGFDREKFSLVICDLVGFGKSTSLEDENVKDAFTNYSNIAYEFMKALQIPKYSYLGWSCSGAAGMILAAKHPEVINKLVVWGSSSRILASEVKNHTKIKDLNNWSKPALEVMIEIYGKENFVKKLNKWADNIEKNYECVNYDHLLKHIKCPTLILYGEKDQMVDGCHVNNLRNLIKNSRVHLYPDGKHNIHIKYAEDFNRRVQDFLLLSSNE